MATAEVFWFSKNDCTGPSARKKKKREEADIRKSGKIILKSEQGGTLPSQLMQLKTGQLKKNVAKSSVELQRSCKDMGENKMDTVPLL